MDSKSKISLIFTFLIFLDTASALEFEASGVPGVEFGDMTAPNGFRQIYVDESNTPGRIVIVIIKNSKLKPEIQIQPNNEDKYLHINLTEEGTTDYKMEVNLLDYEALPSSTKSFYIIVRDPDPNPDDPGTTEGKLLVYINNLDDENPTFTTSNCEMEENTTITIDNSECIFQINDPDGFLDKMDFSDILSTGNKEDELFKLTYKETPKEGATSADVVLILQDGVVLDYEEVTLFSFQVQIKDGSNNPTIPEKVTIIVQVQDIPDMPPIWLKFTSAKRITEKTPQTIEFSAKDGDYGLNWDINYDIICHNDTIKPFLDMDVKTGVISIKEVNRDAGYDSLEFTVVAYEEKDDTSRIQDIVTIMVDDVDDNSPLIYTENSRAKELKIQIDENSKSVTTNLYVYDIDQGGNAMYDIQLLKTTDVDYTAAFQIIPTTGYERTDISFAIIDPSMLDYENDEWKVITFSIQTIGTKDQTHQDTLPVTITLNDLNDELPEFDPEQLTVNVLETIGKDTVIGHIQATDRDAADKDKVKHEIMGTWKGLLSIEPLGGAVTTLSDNIFNYERQQVVYVQIRATDTANQSTVGQLVINVQDVNDEQPRLTVSSAISIPENQDDGTPLISQIEARDDDQNASLSFSIDWTKSKASKNSQDVSIDGYHCVSVITTEIATGRARADLTLIETQKGNTPDYETFDTLFIQLVVTDINTQAGIGTDTATVVINIVNINDNPPVFQDGTKEAKRSVLENSERDTSVGVITATDRDNLGPLSYSIQGLDPDTKDWIGIDRENGNLFVNVGEGDVIDCDNPKRYTINYTVTVTDGEHEASIDIAIEIIDQNDEIPRLDSATIDDKFEDNEISGENSNGQTWLELKYTDNDRDKAYHTVRCRFQEGTDVEVQRRFTITDNKVIVALQDGYTLNREEIPTFKFDLYCADNPDNPYGTTVNTVNPPPTITINLLDVNDKKPTMISKDIINLNENTPQKPITPTINFQDDDEGAAGEISFQIIKIIRHSDSLCTNEQGEDDFDLFSIESDSSKKNAVLTVAKTLKDHYGCLKLIVNATDGGTPQLYTDTNEIKVAVQKYNFEKPTLIYPTDGSTLYLLKKQRANSILVKYNGDHLDNLEATDNQNNKYIIKFKITEDSSENDLFKIYDLGNSVGQLQMKSEDYNNNTDYKITLMAYLDLDYEPINGEQPYNATATFTIHFFDKDDSDPEFDTHTASTEIPENDADQKWINPYKAVYPNITIPDLDTYYLMVDGDKDIFSVDPTNGSISLKTFLDYEVSHEYTVVIQASGKSTPNPDANENCKLTVTIQVKDLNDNPPVFEDNGAGYFGTIVAGGTDSNKYVTTVKAEDADEHSTVTYSISKVKQPENQEQIDKPFEIDNNGNITSTFVVKDEMKGYYFILTVVAADEDGYRFENHTDTTNVSIYIVTTINTVNFKFTNNLETVRSKLDDIRNILNKQFEDKKYQSQPENPSQDTTSDGSTGTVLPIYFIDSEKNSPIEGSVILRNLTNIQQFGALKEKFLNISLELKNFQSETDPNENLEEILKAWLIGVSVVLGAFCMVLLVAFILKTRALKQTIKNLSNTKFGSQESGLNRTGVAAPTTNKHALEGSNPVYNHEPDTKSIDAQSVTSGDSDLIGVEDDEKFDYDYAKKEE